MAIVLDSNQGGILLRSIGQRTQAIVVDVILATAIFSRVDSLG